MVYGFKFTQPGHVYYQGYKTEEEARINLETYAGSCCTGDKVGIGKILFMVDGKFKIISEYKISLKDEELIMAELD